MSNSAIDIQKSIDHLYKVKSKYPVYSDKYKNIKLEIRSLKNKRKEILNGVERT